MKARPTEAEHLEAVELASKLCEKPADLDGLRAAVAQIRRGGGAALFDAMLSAVRSSGAEQDAAIVEVMRLLESMMSADPGVAGYLMGRLHTLAGPGRLNARDVLPERPLEPAELPRQGRAGRGAAGKAGRVGLSAQAPSAIASRIFRRLRVTR